MTAGTSSDGKINISSNIAAATAAACVHMFQNLRGPHRRQMFISPNMRSVALSLFYFLFNCIFSSHINLVHFNQLENNLAKNVALLTLSFRLFDVNCCMNNHLECAQ